MLAFKSVLDLTYLFSILIFKVALKRYTIQMALKRQFFQSHRKNRLAAVGFTPRWRP